MFNEGWEIEQPNQLNKPKPEDFSLQATKEEQDVLLEKLMVLGLTIKDANANIEKQKLHNKALDKFNNRGKQSIKKERPKSRINSINVTQQ